MPTRTDIQSFVQKFLPVAQQMESKYGVPAYALLSQMALETGFGTSPMAQNKNNYGGIAAYDRDPNQALSFNAPEDAIDYQARLLMGKSHRPDEQQKYQSLAGVMADKNNPPETVFAAMQDSPYASDKPSATSPGYAAKLMSRYSQIAPYLNGGVQPAMASEGTPPPAPSLPGTPNYGSVHANPVPTPPPPHANPIQSPQPQYQDNRSWWEKMMSPQVNPTPPPSPQGMQFRGPDGQTSRINAQGQTYPSPSPVAQAPVPGLNWLHDRVKSIFGL